MVLQVYVTDIARSWPKVCIMFIPRPCPVIHGGKEALLHELQSQDYDSRALSDIAAFVVLVHRWFPAGGPRVVWYVDCVPGSAQPHLLLSRCPVERCFDLPCSTRALSS